MTVHAELQVTSHFSFLRGASALEDLFAAASMLGIPALGITDRNSLAGIVRAHEAAKATGVRLVVGCRLDLADGTVVLVYPTDRPAYARLCRLLTLGKGRAGKGRCILDWADLVAHGEGLITILVPDVPDQTCWRQMVRHRDAFDDRAYLALTLRRRPGDAMRLHGLSELANRAGLPTVATGDVLFHSPDRRALQDVLTCIRLGCTIDQLGFRRERYADRHLKGPLEMARLFQAYPEAVVRSLEIVERCRFSLDELAYQYPTEALMPGLTAQEALEVRIQEGLAEHYPDGPPNQVTTKIRHELQLIEELGYAPYFLTVDAIVRFARSRDILCQGRGSAANSVVCFVLGITSVNPIEHDLLFERFISQARKEPPDIDVDFEHDRREEVIQWIYRTYGRHRAALCATVIRYRARGAVRDVGKAMGLSEDVVADLSSQIWGWSENGAEARHAEELNLNLTDRRLRLTLELAKELIGFPRHLSQHPGGFVLTEDRLDELVPIEPAAMADRSVIEWDKDDIDTLRFMKVDVLGLGMLGCLRRAFDLLAQHKGEQVSLATIPRDDPATYAMIRKANTLGVFQIESRAQMAMLPRMKPRCFYDLVIEVAIVRPGPIQGDMVHPYLRRREGKEPVDYPKPQLKNVLGKTLGVPLFQEQAMRVAIECAGFSANEADQLRRSMATFKFTGGVSHFRDKLVSGMVTNGYSQAFAEKTFSQLEGFGSYGFPESHAASFALLAYASSWMKCHHPEVFCAALLNAQPMGFYAPAQIVRDALEHEVEVRPVDVNHSEWDCTLEPSELGLAVRLGLRMVKGLAEAQALRIAQHRPYASIGDLWRRAGVPVVALQRIAEADGFSGSLGLARREAIWAIGALRDQELPLFATGPELVEPDVALEPMTSGGEVVEDYATTGLTLRQHPLAFLRNDLASTGHRPCQELAAAPDGSRLAVAGLVLVRQRPGSASGVLFITIEDEGGIANLVVWPSVFERCRRVVLGSRMLGVSGRVQRQGEVIHLVAERLDDLSGLLASIGSRNQPGHPSRDADIRDLHPGSGIRVPTRDFR
ncbi:error-prone DNA polymerase [Geminicoccus harenae]|uniref:error-prone DNA polymerase n=1 Tax=Geminicoccus harenae TaxID=2498453 RepID=UPI00168C0B18|nr:error-prone DNA polymerase [Geminicoccus harenae]